MDIGDKVQHASTGSIGMVIDTTYELATPYQQQLCIQWEDEKSPHKDSWERRDTLSIIPHKPYVYSFPDQCLTTAAIRGMLQAQSRQTPPATRNRDENIMGYRSQVVLAISKHLTPFLVLATSQNKDAETLVFKDHDTFDRNYGEGNDWLIVWNDIKWYDSYEDIQAIEKFIQEAVCDEYEFEVDGSKEDSSEHIRFVRVGEETGDIEVEGSGFWDIYPNTHICYQEIP